MNPNIPSRAKSFFDKIKSPGHGAEFLKQLVESETPASESEFLDFKAGFQAMLPDSAKRQELKDLWAKCLSGFANSDGGVVIFGINAPDRNAKSLSPVQDVVGLKNRLIDLVPTITEPPVQRVEVEAFPDSPAANTGFVVCHIPASPWRPHQVKVQGDYQNLFFIRAADNCIPCGVSVLRALFAPQNISRLEFYYCVKRHNTPTGSSNITLQSWVKNLGPATARELFAFCKWPAGISLPRYNPTAWRVTQSDQPGLPMVFERSIHPQELIEICTYGLGTVQNNGTTFNFQAEKFDFTFRLAVRDQLPQNFSIKFTAPEIAYGVMKNAVLENEA